jgi:hypothetical protein
MGVYDGVGNDDVEVTCRAVTFFSSASIAAGVTVSSPEIRAVASGLSSRVRTVDMGGSAKGSSRSRRSS